MQKYVMTSAVALLASGCLGSNWTMEERDWIEGTLAGEASSFTVPKADSDAAWDRAHEFIGRYATMKIQNDSPHRVDTFGPLAFYDVGMSASRTTASDPSRFHVGVVAGQGVNIKVEKSQILTQAFARYVRTGKLEHPKALEDLDGF